MPIPETTSVEAFDRYVGGKPLKSGRGKAWRDIKATIIDPARNVDMVPLPAVSEPFIAWTVSGEAEFQERENGGPWVSHHITKGSMFLTSGGAPYDCRWKATGHEPFQSMAVFIALPLQRRAMEEVYGEEAVHARLRDVSAFKDETLDCYMQQVRDELMRKQASPLLVQGLAQSIAVHLARNYSEMPQGHRSGSPSLPGFKLKQITDWMAGHLADECNLDGLAAQVKLSKFHFQRLFKKATGVSPSRYQLNLRMDAARRLLRETDKGVVDVGLEVGYANPSHFAQLFRRETGLSPSDYRRQR